MKHWPIATYLLACDRWKHIADIKLEPTPTYCCVERFMAWIVTQKLLPVRENLCDFSAPNCDEIFDFIHVLNSSVPFEFTAYPKHRLLSGDWVWDVSSCPDCESVKSENLVSQYEVLERWLHLKCSAKQI